MNSVAGELIKYIKAADSDTDFDAKDVNNFNSYNSRMAFRFEKFIVFISLPLLVFSFQFVLQLKMWSDVCSALMHGALIEVLKIMNFWPSWHNYLHRQFWAWLKCLRLSLRHNGSSNICHCREYAADNFHILASSDKWKRIFVSHSFVPPATDRWFRDLVRINKASRTKDVQSNDFFQTLLQIQEKHSEWKFSNILNENSSIERPILPISPSSQRL